jgi:hypothetical protein
MASTASSVADRGEVRIAYVHVLPIEYYPPATNTLSILAKNPGWKVRAWTSHNTRGLHPWSDDSVSLRRPFHGAPSQSLPKRVAGYSSWHMQAALELARWKPHAVMAIEPHSTLAVWLYFEILRGDARLFIHHHEYYAPEDYERTGMRLLRAARRLEGDSLLKRAVWISETNEKRMRMFLDTHRAISPSAAHVLPNYPPAAWVARGMQSLPYRSGSARTKLIYLGSASFEDTFIREAAEWVAAHSNDFELHVTGNNVARDVWDWLAALGAPNITTDPHGIDYSQLAELLSQFDVGLVLYKGNTLNFVYNVPNKAIEYLACGLEVWYPPDMKGMQTFADEWPALRIRAVDFKAVKSSVPGPAQRIAVAGFPFTAESALAELTGQLSQLAGAPS